MVTARDCCGQSFAWQSGRKTGAGAHISTGSWHTERTSLCGMHGRQAAHHQVQAVNTGPACTGQGDIWRAGYRALYRVSNNNRIFIQWYRQYLL